MPAAAYKVRPWRPTPTAPDDLIGATERLGRLEQLSHGGRATYIGNNRLLTKAVLGDHVLAFLVEADDRLIVPQFIIHGIHEPDLTAFFAAAVKPHYHCFDIGANFGYYACLMARLAPQGRVLAVEPTPDVFELLRDNIFINGLQYVARPVQCAIADKEGSLTLHRRATRSGNNSIVEISAEHLVGFGEKPTEPLNVTCRTIDSFLPEFDGRLDIVKIDAEGAEPLVWRGMQQTLEANPVLQIVMEWAPGQIRAAGFDISAFLCEIEAANLRAQIIRLNQLVPVAVRDFANFDYLSGVLLQR